MQAFLGVRREDSCWLVSLFQCTIPFEIIPVNRHAVLVDPGQKYMVDCWLGVFAVCTYNASISVNTLVPAIQMSHSAIVFQHTFRHIFGLLNAFADFAFVLEVGFG